MSIPKASPNRNPVEAQTRTRAVLRLLGLGHDPGYCLVVKLSRLAGFTGGMSMNS